MIGIPEFLSIFASKFEKLKNPSEYSWYPGLRISGIGLLTNAKYEYFRLYKNANKRAEIWIKEYFINEIFWIKLVM